MKIRLIASPDLLLFESKLNQALEYLKDKKILEIQYKPMVIATMSYFTALVIYE